MVDWNDPKAVAAWEEHQRSEFEPFGVSKLEDMLRGRRLGGPEIVNFVRHKLLPEMRENEAARLGRRRSLRTRGATTRCGQSQKRQLTTLLKQINKPPRPMRSLRWPETKQGNL